jgi:hypothetical protein
MQMQMQTQWGTPADACQARVGVPALGVPGHITLRTRAAILRIPLLGMSVGHRRSHALTREWATKVTKLVHDISIC